MEGSGAENKSRLMTARNIFGSLEAPARVSWAAQDICAFRGNQGAVTPGIPRNISDFPEPLELRGSKTLSISGFYALQEKTYLETRNT